MAASNESQADQMNNFNFSQVLLSGTNYLFEPEYTEEEIVQGRTAADKWGVCGRPVEACAEQLVRL